MDVEKRHRFLATHTPFVPQGVPPNLQVDFKQALALQFHEAVRSTSAG